MIISNAKSGSELCLILSTSTDTIIVFSNDIFTTLETILDVFLKTTKHNQTVKC